MGVSASRHSLSRGCLPSNRPGVALPGVSYTGFEKSTGVMVLHYDMGFLAQGN